MKVFFTLVLLHMFFCFMLKVFERVTEFDFNFCKNY